MGYKIGSFNLKNLSTTSLGDGNERDLEMIARIIREEGFDVVALQEVLSEGKAFASKDYAERAILNLLGRNNWDFRWANAESGRADPRDEGYAFIWNKKRLRLSSSMTIDGVERVFEPRICRLNRIDMIRKPFYARFTPVGTGGSTPWIEFRLLCVHTYWGDDNTIDRCIRQHELDVLMKDIYPQISDRRYGLLGNGMPSYTILMGDYNVQLYRGWKEDARKAQNAERALKGLSYIAKPAYLKADENDVIETTRWGNRKVKTVQYEYTTLKADGGGYAHDYDHFSFEEKQFEGVRMSVKRIDAVKKYYGDGRHAEYRKKVSDHIPIMMNIEFHNQEEG